MIMWLRLGGALLITILVMAALEYFGVSSLLGGRSADEVHQPEAQARLRELFWFGIFAVVMTMSVVAALRRWSGQLRHALLVAPALKRRDVA
jgi:hypothetical protein